MDLKIVIKPLVGVIFKGKEINFGMTQKEVESLLGQPATFKVNNLTNQIHEPRDGTIFIYKCEELFSIEVPIGSGIKIFYKNVDILNDKDTISNLSEYDIPTPNNGKYMNFYKLGILLGGFGKKKNSREKNS
jgi:hypothetical protein